MEAKNNKLLNIMIELMKSRNKNEIKNKFNINDKEKVKIIKKGLEEAYEEKDEDKLYYVCSAIWEFNLHTEEWIDILCKLSKENWHNEHEDFASYFQEMRLPRTIDCIYELATSNFEKYRWDDNFALVRKCCFALGDINTPKAKEKLELLLQSDEKTIREHAMEQLKRCNFTNKDVE